jgi:predicted ATPase
LLELVNGWMTERFEMLSKMRFEKLDPEGNVRRLVGDERQGLKGINIADMGEGVSQLLPIVASVLSARNETCLLVEQPEIHLHPAAQATLGDLFVENVGKEHRRQFIVETHSEHLLLRVRRRVAERRIDPKDVGVLLVERGRIQPSVKLLELNGEGSFLEWPKGFFEEGYRESLSLAQATAKRRRKGRPAGTKASTTIVGRGSKRAN